MKNHEVAELLNKIADLLEMQDVQFKPRAYRKAAFVIDGLSEDIEEIWKKGKLDDVPAVGEGIAKKISDFLEHGKSCYLEKLKKQVPVDMEELGRVEGLGPKTMMKLYKKLNVKNINDLEKAAKQHKIQEIEGLGPTAEENLLKSIEFAKVSGKRFLLGYAIDIADEIKNKLKKSGYATKVEIAGSLRRKKETIGDIDILAASKNPGKLMDFFTKMGNVEDVLAKGPKKSMVRLKEGIQTDVRVIGEKSYGAALLYFTGSKQHNIALRKIAIRKRMKLSEYGLFDEANKMLAGKTEEECYKKLGLAYIEPEIREDEGEIQLAEKNRLPRLIGYDDIRGDLQMHTKWSDGNNTIMEMALAAKKLGHEYICITDHAGKLKIANALGERRIKNQRKEIDEANKKLKNFKVLQGIEVNIKADGNLDMKNNVLKGLDVVLASIHSGFKNPREKITKRLIKAMENPNVDIIAHPFGRLINTRPAYEMDFDKVLEKAKQTNTVLEINAYPNRLDLNDVNIRKAIKSGVKLSIGTDAHNVDELRYYELGIATARRGWAEKNDIVNSYSVGDMLKMLK